MSLEARAISGLSEREQELEKSLLDTWDARLVEYDTERFPFNRANNGTTHVSGRSAA